MVSQAPIDSAPFVTDVRNNSCEEPSSRLWDDVFAAKQPASCSQQTLPAINWAKENQRHIDDGTLPCLEIVDGEKVASL